MLNYFISVSGRHFSQVNQKHFEYLSIEQGLPSNSVNCVYQDRKGFIWLGTNNGLVRYDGYECKVYRHDPKNNNSISSDAVVFFASEDSAGNFWVGTLRGGLNKFDRYTNRFTCLKNIATDPNSIHDK